MTTADTNLKEEYDADLRPAHTVLLVDDDQHLLRGLTRMLEEKYYVLSTTSAEGAASILEESAVDVIVCDEHMPGMPGTTFLRQVAAAYPHVGRIVLTGQPEAEIWNRSVSEANIHSFLVKPCPDLELNMTIRRVIKELRP